MVQWSMSHSRRSSPVPLLVPQNRSGMPTRSRAHHAIGIAINISDSFYVHHPSTLQYRIFLTPGPHALCGGMPLSSVLHVDLCWRHSFVSVGLRGTRGGTTGWG